jgi:hypothetical protein
MKLNVVFTLPWSVMFRGEEVDCDIVGCLPVWCVGLHSTAIPSV